jgi:transcriptional regulator GlxA family with amidase domain
LNSRHIGNTAVRQAIRVHQQSGQVARQNRSRILSPARVQVVELVQEVVATPATVEDLQRLIDIVSQDVEDPRSGAGPGPDADQ